MQGYKGIFQKIKLLVLEKQDGSNMKIKDEMINRENRKFLFFRTPHKYK